MTYDDAVNEIVERYRHGEFSGWTMTDADSAQMRRDKGNGEYEFIELFLLPDRFVALNHDWINLDDYEHEDIRFYCLPYHTDEAELFAQPREILSEYLFEQTGGMEFYGTANDTFKRYLKIVKEE